MDKQQSNPKDELANKALEKLGIHINSLQYERLPRGGKRWLCPIKGCCRPFTRIFPFKIHLLSHYEVRPYKCSYENCDWAFYTWYRLKSHIETHLKRQDYVCSESNCNRRFTALYHLNNHLRLHQRPKGWMCSLPECTRAFHSRQELRVHMKTHCDVEAPYKCGVDGCSKSYSKLNSLSLHMRSHHKEEELRCQWTGCGKKFDQPCRLKSHMIVHTDHRPFVCTFEGCDSSFQNPSNLSRHQRKHFHDRKFVCPICQKLFLRSEYLQSHLLIHTGVRNFQCPIEPTDTNQLDYSTLLVDVDLMMDQLLPLTTGGTSLPSSVSLESNVSSSTFSSASPPSDAQATLLSSNECINWDIGGDGNDIAPAIVMEGIGAMETIDSIDVSMTDTLIGTSPSASGVGEMNSLDMATVSKDTADVVESGGSARTDVIGNIIRSQRAKKRQQLNLAKKKAELGCHTSNENSYCNAKFTAKSSMYAHLKKHEGKAKENNNKVTYHCPIDTCVKSYKSNFNLLRHMLKNHTILTTDTNQLDYSTLLVDVDLMMDQLLPLTTGGTSLPSSVSLESNVSSYTFSSASPPSDAQATLLSSNECINWDIGGAGEGVMSFINDVVLSASAASHLQFALLQDDGVANELCQFLMGHDPATDPQSTFNLLDLE